MSLLNFICAWELSRSRQHAELMVENLPCDNATWGAVGATAAGLIRFSRLLTSHAMINGVEPQNISINPNSCSARSEERRKCCNCRFENLIHMMNRIGGPDCYGQWRNKVKIVLSDPAHRPLGNKLLMANYRDPITNRYLEQRGQSV
jgi:hypothetical protein